MLFGWKVSMFVPILRSINYASKLSIFLIDYSTDKNLKGMSSRSLEDVANKDSQRSKVCWPLGVFVSYFIEVANEDVSISDTPLGARGSSRGNNI
ncbi:hypothetical protein Lalb_Chr13g0290661 [Lupinus albus]|uniref:Uncharacterized protein n=1 Tax=Lupinus albus TaxID=3870 RepID=A0A6A4PGX8_LUPAL|nr:hypothetical protein Lalb_Chr13g0290661 [Lupinus albus]